MSRDEDPHSSGASADLKKLLHAERPLPRPLPPAVAISPLPGSDADEEWMTEEITQELLDEPRTQEIPATGPMPLGVEPMVLPDYDEEPATQEIEGHAAPVVEPPAERVVPLNPGRAFALQREAADRYAIIAARDDSWGRGIRAVRAMDLAVDREVWLQVAGRAHDPMADTLLRRTATRWAQIEHPGVPAVLDRGRLVDGRAFVAMQAVDGLPLDAAVLADRPAAIRVLWFACLAVGAAHGVGLVHRTLAPRQIRIGGACAVRVVGWSSARELEAAGGAAPWGGGLDVVSWLAPEQARGQVHLTDRRSDVYALGAILYRMLVGRAPYVAGTPADLRERIARATPVAAPSTLIDGLSPALDAIVLRALSARQDERFADAGAMAEALMTGPSPTL